MKPRRARISYLVVTIAALVPAILFACSSSDSGSPTPVEAGADGRPAQKDAPASSDTGDDDAAPACSPHPLTAPLTWHPPRPFNASACTPSQVDGFVQSCILSSHAVCDAFRQQNPGCASCAYTSADDAAWGPIVDDRTTNYIQINKGGCVASSAGEVDETGCGGSFELYNECLNQTCGGCFPLKTDLKPLYACQGDPQTDTICASYIAQGSVKCPKNGTPATAKCFSSSTNFEDNVRKYVTFWCSTVDDGGVDGGDGGDAATD